MNTEVLIIVVGGIVTVVTGVVSSVVTALLARKKYKTETRSTELDNVRVGIDILMRQIVDPLEKQIKRLNTNVSRFEKAVAKIPACPRAADCPVSHELLADEEGDDGEPAGGQ